MIVPAMTSLVDLLVLMQADMPRVASERKEYKPSRWSRPKFLGGALDRDAGIGVLEIGGSIALSDTRAGHRYLFEEVQ